MEEQTKPDEVQDAEPVVVETQTVPVVVETQAVPVTAEPQVLKTEDTSPVEDVQAGKKEELSTGGGLEVNCDGVEVNSSMRFLGVEREEFSNENLGEFQYLTLADEEPSVQEKPDGTAKYVFNLVAGNWYNSYNIDIELPTPEDEQDCCDKCLANWDKCVKSCAKCFLKIIKAYTLCCRCIIDPCQACYIGCLILYGHIVKVCFLDIAQFITNKIWKPVMHTIYECFWYPLFVYLRVFYDACVITVQPLHVIHYRMMVPVIRFLRALRAGTGNFVTLDEMGVKAGNLNDYV